MIRSYGPRRRREKPAAQREALRWWGKFDAEGASRLRKSMMEILVCPMCKGELQLTVTEEQDDQVVTGSLHCGACNETYPISNRIPNLLPPDIRNNS